jgi:uncharacterized protein (DUF488 family)
VTLYTIGHGARTASELVALLGEAAVRVVADVRRFPASRRHPQHGRLALERSLGAAGIRYVWLGESLGGRRAESVPVEASANAAWRVPAFRNYADAIQTPGFQAGVDELESLAREAPTAILCAERHWSQCHRRILADVFAARGWDVRHLVDPGRLEAHTLPPFARVEAGRVTYPSLL